MKISLWDSWLRDVMKYNIDNNINGISSQQVFLTSIGFKGAYNLSQIKNG